MGEGVANPGPSCWHLGSIFWSLKPWRIRIGPVPGPEVLVLVRGLQCQTNTRLKKVFSYALLWNALIWIVAHETRVYFGPVTLLRQDIQLQSQGQGDSLVMSCRQSFSKSDLEIFHAFHKRADGISAHRASVRMWSKILLPKTLLLSAKPRRT